jgi:hypothetical protein
VTFYLITEGYDMDVRKLKELCEIALPLIDDVDYSKPTPKSLLRALLEKTIDLVDSGINVNDIMFTTVEMVELLKSNVNEQQAKKFKADHYTETHNLLEKVNNIWQENNESASYYKLRLADTGEQGGAKNKKHHYLEIVPVTEIEQSNGVKYENHQHYKADIKYEVVQLPKPLWYVRPFMSIELTKWRLKLYLFIPILILIVGYYFFIGTIVTPTMNNILLLATFFSVMFLIWRPLWPFFEANHKRIAIAPLWMLKFGQLTGQLESVKLAKTRRNGRPYRKIEFVIYEANCPICNHTVEIYKGKSSFKGRLIGICDESPREHIFSFDHITKEGVKLARY